MRIFFGVFIALSLFITSCENDTCTDGQQNGNETGVDCGGDCSPCASTDYYFNISYGGNDYNYESSLFQSGHTDVEEFGGWVNEGGSLFGSALGLVVYFEDSVQNEDIQAVLEGNRIYFSDFTSGPYPAAEIRHLQSSTQYSDYGLSNNYYVDFTEVNFLRNENDLFDIDIYSVKGSFVTRIEDLNGSFVDATGDFFLQCSHGNY